MIDSSWLGSSSCEVISDRHAFMRCNMDKKDIIFDGKTRTLLDLNSNDKYFIRIPNKSDTDIEGLFQCYGKDSNIINYLPDSCVLSNLKDASIMIDYYLMMHKNQTGFYYFIEKNNSSIVGVLGLHSYDKYDSNIEIAYHILTKETGKGLATVASKKLIEFAFEFLKVKRISLSAVSYNFKSKALAERLGFSFEGRFRQSRVLHGNMVDIDMYSMILSEYNIEKDKRIINQLKKDNKESNTLFEHLFLLDNNHNWYSIFKEYF